MRVHSIFFSIDGEVNFMGQGTPTVFLRLQGCNQKCPWCDTKDSLDPDRAWKELSPLEVRNMVLDFIPNTLNGPKVTITGGEPLLQLEEVHSLLNYLFPFRVKVSIETNGTISIRSFRNSRKPNPDICLVVDWKASSSGVRASERISLDEYLSLQEWDWIKFVVASRGEYEEIRDVIHTLNRRKVKARMAISPVIKNAYTGTKGVSHKQVWEWLIDDSIMNVSLNCQIHKLISLP